MLKEYPTSTLLRCAAVTRLCSFPIYLAAILVSLTLSVFAAGTPGAAPAAVAPSSVPAAAASAPLVMPADLVYQGAFRVPQGRFGGSSFDYGGTALAFNPARGSLFAVGHDWQQQVAEITIPTPGVGALSDLPTASVVQPFWDVTEGRLYATTANAGDTVKVGGLLAYRDQLYLTAYVYYDGNGAQRLSHFVSGLDGSVAGDVRGPFQVGTLGAGHVSGYLGLVPAAWQDAFGGPVLNGQCCIPIISRTSQGPALSVIDPAQLGSADPLPVTPLLFYPADHPLDSYGHGGKSTLYNGSTSMGGVVFPERTRSVLFFGRIGLGDYCYGQGTGDAAQGGQEGYCYDAADNSKGEHAYPYSYYVWAYDALDLAAVKSGARASWDVTPYAVWSLTLPFSAPWIQAKIGGVAYDPQSGRIFLSQIFGDGENPLIHVFTIAPGSSDAAAPPTVSVTSPAAGATVAPQTALTLTATANDSDGFVSTVAFFANGVALGTTTSRPYTLDWAGAAAGSYQVTAVATDNEGGTTTSTAVSLTVSATPARVNVAAASRGATAVASSSYDGSYGPGGVINGDRKGLAWGAGGGWNDATLNAFPDWLEVDFSGTKTINEIDVFSIQDQFQTPSEPTAAMTFSEYGVTDFQVQYWTGTQWQAVTGGVVSGNNLVVRTFSFSALTTTRIRVAITQALNSYSRLAEVEAYESAPPSNTAPTVSLAAPANSAALVTPGPIALTASAADSDGTVSTVAFYANGTLIGTALSTPFGVNWSAVAAGTYQVTAVATDNGGKTATSNAVTVVVRAKPVPPTVSLASPINGSTFTSPSTIKVTAAASDSDGTVSAVAFYANGALIGTDSSNPYSVDWSGASAGTYQLTATATDSDGQIATSSAVSITVTSAAGRVNVAAASNGGKAVASSSYSSSYGTGGAIDGDRKGLGWGAGGGWNDATLNAFPDWLEVDFSSTKTITEVNVFTIQDNVQAPSDPTSAMNFSLYGLTDFQVQYWDGTQWLPIPGATVSGNKLVWRQFTFAALTTSRIRVMITGALSSCSRIAEIEAFETVRVNVAAAINGATAVASTTFDNGYAPSSIINGDRKGLAWGTSGGWNDGTLDAYPDWLEVDFSGTKTIREVNVFTVQDNFQAPSDPTLGMNFSLYGLTDFQVQYWDGTKWLSIPGAAVSGNRSVWRQFTFAALTTSRIRVLITGAMTSYSRVTEVEAF